MRRHPAPAFPIHLLLVALVALATPVAGQQGQQPYYPGAGDAWERRSPADVGMDPALVDEAVRFAVENETDASPDLERNHYVSFGREPYGEGIGPFKVRGPATGIIVRNGYIVAEWGDPQRVDMTFSVTKSFLSTTVGLAWDRELIRDLDDRVAGYMSPLELPEGDGEPGVDREGFGATDPAVLFRTEHNRGITWDHLLRQTSDWEGTLWGKPDWADRPQGSPGTWLDRERNEPGTSWKYNDVRVNLLALAATNVWRRPLQSVLREYVMDPIGASRTWRWHGYRNSWVTLDGFRMQVPSGGGHWGGGMWISARDQARFGLLTLRGGRWRDRQILSEAWLEMARTPTGAQPGYGFMNFFLNTDRERFPAAPESAFAHLGAGTNMVYVDPEHDLVVVARWIDGGATAELVEKVLASVAAVSEGAGAAAGAAR